MCESRQLIYNYWIFLSEHVPIKKNVKFLDAKSPHMI